MSFVNAKDVIKEILNLKDNIETLVNSSIWI